MNFSYWKKDWFIGLLVALIFSLIAITDSMPGLDQLAYDLGVKFSASRAPNQNVVVIAIDDNALVEMGSWPWPRDLMAKLTRKLVTARPKVIGYALPFDSRQSGRSISAFSEIKKLLGNRGSKLVTQVEAGLDTDEAFANSLQRSGRVVMAVPYHPAGSVTQQRQADVSEDIARYGIQQITNLKKDDSGWFYTNPVPRAGLVFPPIEELSRYAGALGHIRLDVPKGESARNEPLVIRSGQTYLPSFALMMAARSKSLGTRNIKLDIKNAISLPSFELSTDDSFHIYPAFYSVKNGKQPFRVYSILDVLHDSFNTSVFKNKSVLIGLTARQQVNLFDTPLGEPMAPVMVAAHQVSSLLNKDNYYIPEWVGKAQLLTILLIGLYLMFVLPRFRIGTGFALTALLLVVIINVHFVSMMTNSTWIPLMVPFASLFIGHVFLGAKHLFEDKVGGIRKELSHANRIIGQTHQSQGQLDQAFEQYRRCIVDNSLLDTLYNLGLDYERKRQFNKAITVFRFIEGHNKHFQDVDERIKRNQEMTDVLVLGSGNAAASNGTLILSNPGVQKPMLGRYQIDKELGRGAMGMVYLGHDPKIGRTVAIKTMVLAQEFEGEQLDEVKRRFFREAETAGRLNHPNIVTIYDVGEDQDLSYIAMDYLKGDNLQAYCSQGSLLPTETVFELMIKVADALSFAHQQNVVHRDIKPANIIYDPESGTLKVTDFGVACVTDASKTKTGTILGSPSYMSPEQLAGKKVDGRSDLFSLGVTMYQMLTGELPFIGESLASLMYKIANEKHPDVRMFRPDLPSCASKIVNKALHKDIERRFQSGEKFEQAIQRCLEQL
ncbi:MAG: CHASE2 domain-containing protein [Gammaproteobacteria bacterium]|nr:CHASE2 domain-containing protein [Gammaproteobacteria bacterium]MDH5776698.1 CHASE2 domain-containing protein [Gammaproteobacteria bacterium]